MTQKELDLKKYLDSAKNGKDMCGTYSYCIFCNKKLKKPCIAAYNKAFKNFLWRAKEND